MSRIALITGLTGQDGSYLAELLIDRGYDVHGIVRRVALEHPDHRLWRIRHLLDRVHLHAASLDSLSSLYRVFHAVQPEECYHLAAQSFVATSFEDEFSTMQTNITGTHHVLSALKDCAPQCRVYFAASSEMFGQVASSPQDESTPFHPRSPYGISKVAGFDLTRYYREAHHLHASSGILYNHESPRRGLEFVTRKITSTVARIHIGLTDQLELGNLDARRDWGHSRDYVQAMHLMLQQDTPDDYVIATGEQHSVLDFVREAFRCVGIDWQEAMQYVTINPAFFRPADVETLCGDASKAKRILGWKPTTSFTQFVREMVESDIAYYVTQQRS
ncbi:MAG TPA: GDP-mannose 4,6-dehydratase [Verrucomicrobiae bacterium]|nr:GDP-mannose 4,6-dehydratase [Verrucomicrobiae bacterium]